MYTSVVFIYNANLDNRPDPGSQGQVAQGQKAQAKLPYSPAGISGIEVMYPQKPQKYAQDNIGRPVLGNASIGDNRRDVLVPQWIRRRRCIRIRSGWRGR